MTEQKHTPEPWTTDAACGFPRDVHDAEGMLIAHCSSEFAARRIVAAINACAHIPTDRLEMAMSGQMRSSLDNLCNEVERLEQQRDQLRAALAAIIKACDACEADDNKSLIDEFTGEIEQQARAALAATV